MSREEVGARLGRLLAMVPWIAAQPDGANLEELAARFDTNVARVEKDLRLLGEVEPEALSNVTMYEEDGRFFVDTYSHLAQPFRITANEAFELIASAHSILQVPGADPNGALASAIGKAARAIGGDIDGLEIHLPRPPLLDELVEAADSATVVEIEYYSASRDAASERVVEPLAAFTAEGRWHLIAFCRRVGEERDFRADRVRSVRPTGESFVRRAPTMRTDVAFDPAAADRLTVGIEVQPEQRWALDRYPVRDVREVADGAAEFALDVVGEAWFERLLLRLGPTARVIEPAGSRVGADAAQRLLDAYR